MCFIHWSFENYMVFWGHNVLKCCLRPWSLFMESRHIHSLQTVSERTDLSTSEISNQSAAEVFLRIYNLTQVFQGSLHIHLKLLYQFRSSFTNHWQSSVQIAYLNDLSKITQLNCEWELTFPVITFVFIVFDCTLTKLAFSPNTIQTANK